MESFHHVVLCVDDEINVLNALKRLFRKEAFQVLTASSGAEALKLLQENRVTMIISDQRMPTMTGTEMMAKVKETSPDIVRMILTGYTDVDTIADAINMGHVYKFFLKPWNDQALILEIRQALEQYELVQTNKALHRKVQEQNETLRYINENLENLVRERTREIEIHNHALALSHAILEDLPIPIIGVSSEKIIALINQAVHTDLKMDPEIQIGSFISDYFSETVERKIIEVMISGIPQTIAQVPLGFSLWDMDIKPLSGRFSGKGVILAIKGKP
jgi:response regulator RpfG family c-di-GMP phosphodiesterase